MLKILLVLLGMCTGCFAGVTPYLIQTWKTKHLIPVYFVRRAQIPMVDISVVFDAGSARDGKAYGLASLTSSLLSEGVGGMSADQVAKSFDSVGAVFSSATFRDMALVSLRSLARTHFLAPALKTYLLVLSKPTFSPRVIARVKKQTLDEIRFSQQSSSKMARDRFYAILYHDHPYGHPVDGTLNAVAKIKREAVVKFFSQHYVRQNATIVLVGNFTLLAAKKVANKIDAVLPSGNAPPKLKLAVDDKKGSFVFIPMQVDQNAVTMGELGVNRKNPDYYDLKVASHIFGGDNLVSILFEELRNRLGLAYSVYSYFSPLGLRGPFFMAFETRSDKSAEAVKVVKEQLKKYRQSGPTEKQLLAAKKSIIGSFPLRISTNSAALANVINIAFYHLPIDYLTQYPKHINAVTVDSAKSAFAKKIKLDKLITVVAGRKTKSD